MRKNCIAIAMTIPAIVSVLPSTIAYALTEQSLITVTNSTGNSDMNGSIAGKTNTVRYVNYDGTDLVKITELADAIGEKVTKKNNGLEVHLNNRKVTVNTNTGYAYIDDKQVYDKAIDQYGNYVIPKKVVQDKLEILCCYDSIRIYKEKQSNGTIKVESVTKLSGYDYNSGSNTTANSDSYNYNSGSNTTVNSDGSITTTHVNGARVTTGNDYTAIHNTSQNSVISTANGFTPIYDYTERDYRDIYLEDHDFDLTKYDGYFDATIKQIMNAERAAKINEGWHTKDGKCYFLKNGVPVTGWYKDVVTWYYFNSDGSMKTGWLNDKGSWYYLYDSGAMAQNVCVNGYYMNQYGACTEDKPANAPTGISYKELTNRLINLGFSHKRRYDYNSKLPFKIDVPTYEFGWYPYYYLTSKCDVCVKDDNSCYISTNYASGIKDLGNAYHTMLSWLCPTQVNEIYDKINAKPDEKQTIYADGRVIEVSYHLGGIDLKIKDQ